MGLPAKLTEEEQALLDRYALLKKKVGKVQWITNFYTVNSQNGLFQKKIVFTFLMLPLPSLAKGFLDKFSYILVIKFYT